LGRGVHVDKASVKPGMIGRQFRQMQVLLRAHAGYLKGIMLYTGRAVDCAGSRALAHRWRIVRPDGTVLRDWDVARPSVSRVQWGGRWAGVEITPAPAFCRTGQYAEQDVVPDLIRDRWRYLRRNPANTAPCRRLGAARPAVRDQVRDDE
jgi:hypothetical protein